MLTSYGPQVKNYRTLLAILFFLFVSAPFLAAQGPITCSIGVVPASGFAPLPVNASGTCFGNSIVTQTITWGDGNIDSVNPGPFSVPHTFATAGIFTVTVSAVDLFGDQGTASQNVVVSPNLPPTCTLGVVPLTGTVPLNVTATGNCTDPDGDTITTTLNWGDGTIVPGPSGTHTYTTVGVFTVVLTGTDSAGLTGTASQTVTVNVNLPPTCTLSVTPLSGTVPLSVTATGSCTDPDGDTVTTTLNWGDGTIVPGPSGSHTYTTVGKFTVVLTGTDPGGLTGNASQTVTVNVNLPPTCTLNVVPTTGPVPLSVTATGSCTDPDGDTVTTSLNWGDGTIVPGPGGNHTYTTVGKFTVVLTGTDPGGLTGTATQTVTVSTNPPPTCTLSVVPTSGLPPLLVTATGNCTDTDGDTITTVLDWGDGTKTPAASGTHTYTASGTYQVVVTATDVVGGTGSAQQTVTVFAPGTCSLQVTPTTGVVPLTVTATATCADPGKTIASTYISFGDGFYQGGLTATHTITSAGTVTVGLTSLDHSGKATEQASSSISATDTPTLFVGVSSGLVKQFDKSGHLIKTLDTKQGGSITGMAFDSQGALYVTAFTADTVTKFDGSGTLVGNFGSGYDCKPESIVFDNEGNAYVGETGCSHALLKFDAYGNLLAGYSVSTENEGSDWIDIGSDQCTVFYTSQGTTVFRFNACTGTQLPTFASGLSVGLAVRILPDGGMLIANQQNIVRLDSAGRTISTYTSSGESCWVSLTLDPDGKSFWAVDYCTSDIIQFDITSGNQLAKFNSGTATQTVFGIAMRGPVTQTTAAGALVAAQQNVTVTGGQSGSVDLLFAPQGGAVNQSFSFSCANLPIGATCSFSPQSATATATGVTTTLTIGTTKAAASLAPSPFAAVRIYALWLFVPGLFVLPGFRKSGGKNLRFGVFILGVALLAAMIACGGGSSSSSTPTTTPPPAPPTPSSMNTPPGTYTIVVRATSSSLVSSTVVTLKVQ